MRPFTYTRAGDVNEAVKEVSSREQAKFIAGGTNLLDLMKIDVMAPQHLVDITRIALKTIEETKEGGLRLGALVTNADTAYHEQV
ncbi:MAG: FAD binding domain-containing protein, partial [Hymenobacteraceae bacterium]|nr:FAD binding domain-containing protein [Hymenobacteraceae bacterium]